MVYSAQSRAQCASAFRACLSPVKQWIIWAEVWRIVQRGCMWTLNWSWTLPSPVRRRFTIIYPVTNSAYEKNKLRRGRSAAALCVETISQLHSSD